MRELSDALQREGEPDLAQELFAHSCVLVRDEGSYKTASASDPVIQKNIIWLKLLNQILSLGNQKGSPLINKRLYWLFRKVFKDEHL